MVDPVVIDLSDSDPEDDVQVVYERREGRRANNGSNPSIINNTRRRLNPPSQNDGDDDDVQIMEERIAVPERPPAVERPLLHVPGGAIPLAIEGPVQRERRSFQNARGPVEPHRFRSPDHVSVRAQQRRRQAQLRAREYIQQELARAHELDLHNQAQFERNRDYHRYNAFEDPDFFPGMFIFQGHGDYPGNNAFDQVDQHIMNIIEQREREETEKKILRNTSATENHKKTRFAQIEQIKSPFTTKIDTEEDYVCTLCGVTLGEGVPNDFKGNVSNTLLPVLQEQNDVQAPYQAISMVTDADRDLSKRIFMSTCGHTYCGRCVKNISNIGAVLKKMKPKPKSTDNSIGNPYIYAPPKCVGPDCKVNLRSRTRFWEVFI